MTNNDEAAQHHSQDTIEYPPSIHNNDDSNETLPYEDQPDDTYYFQASISANASHLNLLSKADTAVKEFYSEASSVQDNVMAMYHELRT